MEKVYSPQSFEKKIYEKWEKAGAFRASVSAKKPYTIMMPPPNITGQLHIGHALDNTLQDLLIRFKRMKGFEALWQPGTDHASIATEVKIIERLAGEGVSKEQLGREGFLERAWQWKEEFGGRIVEQFRHLGNSCDWDRLAFTMDDKCSEAVKKFFVKLYNQGLIYKGSRIINWCPTCKTALSDAEVEYEEAEGSLWHIKYPVKDSGEFVTVATTRPETMLGDTAVCVNPADKRYKHLAGKALVLPLVNREIPVISDEYVDVKFGTGAVKITPAHDPNDFEIGVRHKLPTIRVMNDDGTMNDLAGDFAGLDRFEARKKIVEALKQEGLLAKIEPHHLSRGQCYRCNAVVEPIVSEQWFVKTEGLAAPAIEAVKSGKIRFVPKYFEKTYFNWMNNIKDWCISRQLWWGHRIPAYYCGCGQIIVAEDMPKKCPKCGGNDFTQDPDVLDTWFSSGLWPFSTLGFHRKSEDFKYFYPTDVLVTGYEIIFFWVARMIMSGLFETGEIPFRDVLIHGMVRDSRGRKMSKSLGNGVDPIEIIEKYGADSLRFSLVQGITNGADIKFSEDKVEAARNFCNKLWNASRYVLMNIGEEFFHLPEGEIAKKGNIADKWILHKLNETVKTMTGNIEKYELGNAAAAIYDFVWSDFCDWYIELSKTMLYSEDKTAKNHTLNVLLYTLKGILKLLHPFIPFITEEIWGQMPCEAGNMLITAAYPEYKPALKDQKAAAATEEIMETVKAVRTLRVENTVPPSKRLEVFAQVDMKPDKYAVFQAFAQKLANIDLQKTESAPQDKTAMFLTAAGKFFVPLASIIDFEKERARLKKEIEEAKVELARAEQLLSNQNFTAKAPPALIEKERQKTEKFKIVISELEAKLQQI